MKFSILASSLALCALGAADSIDVGSVISAYYPTSTPNIKPAASTSLASAIESVATTWFDSPAYSSAESAIFSAAPSSALASISKFGYAYPEITAQPWYSNVPKAQKSAIAQYISAQDSVAAKIVGTPSTSTGGAARETGLAVAGLVGVMGVLAAL